MLGCKGLSGIQISVKNRIGSNLRIEEIPWYIRKKESPIALVKETEGYPTPIFNTILTIAYEQTFLESAIVSCSTF